MSSPKRVRKYLVPSFLILILAVSAFAAYQWYPRGSAVKADPNVNVGIAFCGNTTAEAKLLIDRTKSYTNLFILDSGGNPISKNQTIIEEICDYAVAQGLKIIVNVGTIYIDSWFWQSIPLDNIMQRWTQRWGDKFLGIYYNDEPGGIQLDGNWTNWFLMYADRLSQVGDPATDALYNIYLKMQAAKVNGPKPQDYDVETQFFIQNVLKEDPGLALLKNVSVNIFTSDYCLYWFDYLGGYNTLFAELGWNHSVAQQIGLVKGAARLQNKDWGTTITWKYNQAPYLDSGEETYNQMLTSYEAGAKYIILFNYPIITDYGVMSDEHFIALERFWKDITTQKFPDLSQPEAVLVLPKNYGWGMRSPTDTIWGFWIVDDKAQTIGAFSSKLLAQYGAGLDIVYDDPNYPVGKVSYKNVYYWNSTR